MQLAKRVVRVLEEIANAPYEHISCRAVDWDASPVSAQVDTQKGPRGPTTTLSEHRAAALNLCTDGIKFASDRYVACMLREGETP
jgi:hypothetical protein